VKKSGFFRLFLAGFSFIVVGTVFLSIASLLFVDSPDAVIRCLFSEEILYAFRLSLTTAVISTSFVICAAVPVAYLFSRYSFFGKRLMKTILYIPVAFPEIVLGLCLLMFFGSDIVRRLFQTVGLDFVFSKQGIVLAQFFTALPYAIRIIKSAFDGIDPQYEFVSRSLGYTPLRTFIHISLPLAKRGILAAVAISFARCAGAFGSVLILAGGTRMVTETLPIALFLNISYGNMSMAVAAGLMLVVIAFAGMYIIETIESDSDTTV
jgi:molybdate transport system permease protein